jgi:hypothetical protein
MEDSNYDSDESAKNVSLADSLGPAVAEHAAQCLNLFRRCMSMPGIVPDCTIIDDQLARFRLWTADMAVHESQHTSLDYRIRLNPTAAEMLHQLLEIICDTLLSCKYLCTTLERIEERG